MARVVIDLTDTGLVIGTVTVDWVKQISDGASVSLTSHTLTERGNGIYIYANPNVTEDSDFRMHVTSDVTNYVVGILSLADGDLALNSTVAKEATLINGTNGLGALKILIDAVQLDLNNPDQYKADITALALEATVVALNNISVADVEASSVLSKEASLDEIKGVGFDTNQHNLKEIKNTIG